MNYEQQEKAEAQIQNYCDGNGWTWKKLHRTTIHGMMYVEFGWFESPAIIGAEQPVFNYYIGLHELGHMVHGHTQGRPPKSDEVFYFTNGVLRSEAQAWEWAMDNALYPPDNFTRKKMWHMCMGSYYAGGSNSGRPRLFNGDRDYCPEGVVWDKADDYFFGIKDRMLEGVN